MSPIVLSSVDMACHYSGFAPVGGGSVGSRPVNEWKHGQIKDRRIVLLIPKCWLDETWLLFYAPLRAEMPHKFD